MIFWDALLDSVDARESLVRDFASTHTEHLLPDVALVVAVAARRRRVDREEVREAALPLDRRSRMLRAHLVDSVADWHETHLPRRREAKLFDSSWRNHPPVRNDHLYARSIARALERKDADPPRLIVGGRVPELERLGDLTDAELNLLLRRFGMDRDRGALLSTAVADVASRVADAPNPDDALVQQVLSRAETAVRLNLLSAAKGAVRDYRAHADRWEDDTELRWVSRLPAPGVCPSCVERHNLVMTWAEWQSEGEPGSPNTICNGQCLCELDEV